MFQAIIVDEDARCRTLFAEHCAKVGRIRLMGSFSNAADALMFAQYNTVDIAGLQIDLADTNGIELARQIQLRHPHMVPIYITENKGFALDAYQLNAASYLLKPCEGKQLSHAIRRACCLCEQARPRVLIRTFGHFDVFVNEKPLKFFRQKSKEILAYLVDRNGGLVTVDHLINDLWEDRATEPAARASYQVAFKDLRKDLHRAGIDDILISSRNQKAIDVSRVRCDYYDLLAGDEEALRRFPDQYMMDYSWAENTNAFCIQFKQQHTNT